MSIVLNSKALKKELFKLGNSQKAKILARFFKTGLGEYGEGDIFWGLTVPQQRQMAKKFAHLSLKELKKLLLSKVHEHRLTALLILVAKFQKAKEKEQEKIVNFYLENTKRVNNWDLVDLSAPKILGVYLLKKNKSVLYQLARSENLWEKRMAIITTFEFIKNNQFKDALKISKILLSAEDDLIHKAVGWMLREVGKKDQVMEENFLKKHYQQMPRTMLRYAIEKFAESKRQAYLKGQI